MMHDPFPIPPPAWLTELVTPVAEFLKLYTLPLHIHEILFAALSYQFICSVLSPLLSTIFFPQIYSSLPRRTRLNWDVHFVSMVQSITINSLALWVMWVDKERGRMTWDERIWGYDGAGGMIQGFAAGYFLWDLIVCVRWVDLFGWGMLAHAISALVVFSVGFRPFVNFYGPTFILYELSSPFLNMHWFFDKLHMTGSRAQWYNGILLLASFFSCRLLWGTYQSIRVYQDVWAGLHYKELPGAASAGVGGRDNWEAGIMRFAKEGSVPTWLACTYLGSNIVLNTLNFYWFGKMIETVKKRFRGPQTKGPVEVVIVEGTEMDAREFPDDPVFDEKQVGNQKLPAEGETISLAMDIDEGEVTRVTEIRRRKV